MTPVHDARVSDFYTNHSYWGILVLIHGYWALGRLPNFGGALQT